jgi:hypothetical protein
MNEAPFRYNIKNGEIAKELISQGFTLHHTSPECWTLEAPPNLTPTKARKFVSLIIKLYITAKDMNRAQAKYAKLLEELEQMNQGR